MNAVGGYYPSQYESQFSSGMVQPPAFQQYPFQAQPIPTVPQQQFYPQQAFFPPNSVNILLFFVKRLVVVESPAFIF